MITYGMVGDRLSDLVAELREIGSGDEALENVVTMLDTIRALCDFRSVAAPLVEVGI